MAGSEGRRATRNGVPGKIVKVTVYERFVPDDYHKHQDKNKKGR